MSRRVIVMVLVVVAVGAAGWWFLGRDNDARETAVAQRGSIDVTIQTIGTIQATGADAVRARSGGRIDQLGAEAGDVVQAGDIIGLLDAEPYDNQIARAEQQLEQEEYALQLVETRLAAEPENPSIQLEAIGARQRVREATAVLDDARGARAEVAIVAPRDGTIIELTVGPGDAVAENQQIARIASDDDLSLVADVDELDLPNVSPGAAVRFRLDAFPATELGGIVDRTAPQARAQGGATVFPTTITFAVPDGLDVRAGMNADVTIVTDARNDVLLIPERALRTVGDRVYATVVNDGSTEERELLLGYRGNGQVEVVDGLREGEIVVLQ